MLSLFIKSILILFIILSLLNCNVHGQDTTIGVIDPTGKCEKYIGDTVDSQCSKYLPNLNSIYVTSNQTQLDAMKTLDEYFSILYTIGGKECTSKSNTYQTLCSMFLPECQTFKNNVTNVEVAIPKRICMGTCLDVTATCKVPEFYFSCKKIEPVTGVPLFPLSITSYNLTGYQGIDDETTGSLSIQCYASINDNTTVEVPISSNCPAPLLYHNSKNHDEDFKRGYLFVSDNSNCVIPNPVPVYTPKQWDNIYRLSDSLSVLSCLGALFVLITFNVINPKVTRFDRMNGYFNASVFMMSLSGVIILFAGGTRSLIKDGGARISVWEDPLCSACGFIFQFFSISAILFWVIMSFDLWYSIRYINKHLNIMKYYVSFILVVALTFSIIPLATKNYRLIRGNVHCWVNTTKLQNGLFWFPLLGAITIATIFLVLVIVEIYKIVKNTGSSNSGFKNILMLELKPILNIVLIYTTFLYLFAFNFYMNGQEGTVYGQIEPFFECTLTSPDPSQCTVQGPSIGSLGFFVFCIRIHGCFIFILQGVLSSRTYKIWRKSIFLNNKFVQYLRLTVFISGGNSGGNRSSTTASTTNSNFKKTNNGYSTNAESQFSKNYSDDDSDDDFDPYRRKQHKSVEISNVNNTTIVKPPTSTPTSTQINNDNDNDNNNSNIIISNENNI